VYGWDVINEMMHEKDYFQVMPRTEAANWFKLARQYDPKATLFINEYSMLNNVASPKNIQTYLELIKELQGYGAPIDAIGVQGHVGRQPRDPVQVITDLDMFRSTGLPVQITEFDINSPDEELQADYTRDFLIACYSHPVINGFTMWGFWEAAHWKPDAAMFRKDWTPKPNAAVWRKLVLDEWHTKLSQASNANGEVVSRGHFGRYEITVTKGKSVVTENYQLTKKAKPVQITL
jgi:GH35 family endo-1,4-beta-xylanase